MSNELPHSPTPDGGELALPTGASAAEVKRVAAENRAALARQVAEVNQRHAEAKRALEEQRAQMEADFRAKTAALQAQMAPLKAELAKLTEVAWTVDLYLGRDETLQQLRGGAPAPLEAPIAVRQRVLVMAEESLILMGDGRRGMDADNIEGFVEWLLAAPENLDQVLPEPKGVVVLIPTRVERKSGNDFEDAYYQAQNKRAHWLIRNGERLWVLTTDERLDVGERILPNRDEFTEVFEPTRFGGLKSPLEPGSAEWLNAEAVASARRRHFMRIVMVLQGLADRTVVWQPMRPNVNFFDLASQDDGKIVLIRDGDKSVKLGDGREPFADWQRRLNAMLRPGLRVVGNWHDADRDALYPAGARGLKPSIPYLIEDRRRGELVIRFDRADEVWRRNVPIPDRPGYVWREAFGPALKRASLMFDPRTDKFMLAYDLATVAELEGYLRSRDERSSHFLRMVPVVKAALAAKKAEAAEEAPFRVLLRDVLLGEGAEHDRVDDVLEELVHWWKVANLWARPLNGDPQHEAKAIAQIRAEYRARRPAGGADVVDRMVAAGRQVPGAIAVAKHRTRGWCAYSPSGGRAWERVWLDRTPINLDGTLGEPERWVRVQPRTVTRLQVAWCSPEWEAWNFAGNPNHYLTDEERSLLVDDLRAAAVSAGKTPVCVVEEHSPSAPGRRTLTLWAASRPVDAWQPFAADDPFSWHWESKVSLAADRRQVVKLGSGITTQEARVRTVFGRYSTKQEGALRAVPWGEPGSASAQLVWADEDVLSQMGDYRKACRALWEQEHEESRARDRFIYRYVYQLTERMRVDRDRELRARFDEDYGLGASDLWEGYLAGLKLDENPVHARMLWGLLAIAVQHGEEIEGRSLADLANTAAAHRYQAPGEWHTNAGDVAKWLPAYGSMLVPSVPAERSPAEARWFTSYASWC